LRPEPRSSAAVLLYRQGEGDRRYLLWLRRGAALHFGGFYAFAGGKVEASDQATPVVAASGEAATLRAAAARELFEETGILAASGAERLPADERQAARRALIAGSMSFAELCRREGLTLEAGRFVDAGRWITPEFYPVRFDTHFFLVELPVGQAVSLEESGESQGGGFVSVHEALARWRTGQALLHPPALNAFAALSLPEVAQTLDRLRDPPFVENHIAQRIEFQEGILLVPQRTPTLPPATHTSCFLVGRGELLIVDPGAADEGELGHLFPMIDALKSEGRRPLAIALTHHHHDHVAGVPAVAARYGLPIWAHPLAAERLASHGIEVDRALADEETLALGDFRLTALHTPGHTRDHLCFLEPESGALLAGDLVSSVSTIVIDPPEGDMPSYLASLRRLLDLDVHALYPAHGPVVADGPAKLRAYLDHRLERERQILQALAEGLATPAAIVPRVYEGTPQGLFPFAERSVQAHLDKLFAEGKVLVRGDGYVVRSQP
jgi:ribonuclease/clavin/mitogillin